MRKNCALVLVIVLSSCTTIVDVVDAVRFDPPAVYREWYDLTSRCVGPAGSFDSIEWFVVPGDKFKWLNGRTDREIAGLWVAPHRIYIADGERLREWVIRHESIHDLLQNGAHPTPPFGLCATGGA